VAAAHRAARVAPGREAGGRADEAGHQRALGQAELLRALAEQAARHGVHAVDAAAEVDAVQVQLQDLVLGERLLQHERQHRLLGLPPPGAAVGEEERAGELLGEGAAAFRQLAPAQVAPGCAAHGDGIEADVAVEAMVLHRHHRLPHVGSHLRQRHVAALLVEREPGPAVGAEEDGVAHAPAQLVDGPGVPPAPVERPRPAAQRGQDEGEGDGAGERGGTGQGLHRARDQAADRHPSG
jgi:hypothetical protein